jgi:long-chain acyl-CoA synthetase
MALAARVSAAAAPWSSLISFSLLGAAGRGPAWHAGLAQVPTGGNPTPKRSDMDRNWLKHYPAGVPAHIDLDSCPSVTALMDDAVARFGPRVAVKSMGNSMTYAQLGEHARALTSYLQQQGLQKGDRVAVMLPNLLQYPVAMAGVLAAGLVLVNVNPLYTPRELEHQLKDSGAKAIVILENFAHVLAEVLPRVGVKTIVLASMGDMLDFPKSMIVNLVVRKVKKLVPAYSLPTAVRWNVALAEGRRKPPTPVVARPDDIAVLQYTGGTTGVSKGATLLHSNLVAAALQFSAWVAPALKQIPAGEQVVSVGALPLYHIFGFMGLIFGARVGACGILIPNPRDIGALLDEIGKERFHVFPAVNTLFHAMLHHPRFDKVDWSSLVLSIAGGMALQQVTARLWKEKTGSTIYEGYGLSETSPTASFNAIDGTVRSGVIGFPLPSTDMAILDDQGREVAVGEAGEIAIRGPQVMAGYWQRPDETAKVMTADGFFRSGDVGVMDEDGCFRIVDRKKDMILVSGFNVYPAEIEDYLTQHPGVLECAAIGVDDAGSGEAVKVFVVRKDPALTEADVRDWCVKGLTNYKRPRQVEFIPTLPKTPVGKVLRRELRTHKEKATA